MPEFDAFLMHPISALHIGERGVGMEATSRMVHSDTLFGAICWSWRLLHGEDELLDLLDRFLRGAPPFLISSAFPFIGDIYLLPKPLEGLGRIESDKRVRKAWLVSHTLFQRITQGKGDMDYRAIDAGAVIAPEEEGRARDLLGSSPPWTTAEPPRVMLDRSTMRSEIYHVGELRFAEGCGLYMLVEFRDEAFRGKLEGALRLLGDEGIGGERSSGRGMFLVEKGSIKVGADEGSRAVLLSLCRPGREEVPSLANSSYNIVLRRGWAGASGHRKRGLRMLSEGSVVACSMLGSIVDVISVGDRKVYSYGLGLLAAMRDAE
ncbi:MAG: type III-A CRISPR-associated RAMP protein Csm4 [Methanotrichaceae archaeon]|nr:type III-A CRISPR-associated RAMP protein Csm4 [Methanotrichaceae archaeon]